MTFKNETWKAVVNYDGLYEVSDLGRVRRLNYKGTGKVKILSPGLSHGYLLVALYKDGERKNLLVHRLVVTAFIGPISKGFVVNHLNENKTDNRLSNLEVCTPKQNNNWGTRNERAGKAISKSLKGRKFTEEWKRKISKANSKQLDLIEADWPYRELTFENSLKASEFFNYKSKDQVGTYIYHAKNRGENWINLRGTRYIFAQACS